MGTATHDWTFAPVDNGNSRTRMRGVWSQCLEAVKRVQASTEKAQSHREKCCALKDAARGAGLVIESALNSSCGVAELEAATPICSKLLSSLEKAAVLVEVYGSQSKWRKWFWRAKTNAKFDDARQEVEAWTQELERAVPDTVPSRPSDDPPLEREPHDDDPTLSSEGEEEAAVLQQLPAAAPEPIERRCVGYIPAHSKLWWGAGGAGDNPLCNALWTFDVPDDTDMRGPSSLAESIGYGKVFAIHVDTTDKDRVWTGHEDGQLHIWSASSGASLTSGGMRVSRSSLRCMDAGLGADCMWVGSSKGNIRIVEAYVDEAAQRQGATACWKLRTKQQLASGGQRAHPHGVRCLLRVGSRVWSSGGMPPEDEGPADIKMWGVEEPELLQRLPQMPSDNTGEVRCMARVGRADSQAGPGPRSEVKWVATAHESGQTKLWDAARGVRVAVLGPAGSPARALVAARGLLCSGHEDGTLRVWRAEAVAAAAAEPAAAEAEAAEAVPLHPMLEHAAHDTLPTAVIAIIVAGDRLLAFTKFELHSYYPVQDFLDRAAITRAEGAGDGAHEDEETLSGASTPVGTHARPSPAASPEPRNEGRERAGSGQEGAAHGEAGAGPGCARPPDYPPVPGPEAGSSGGRELEGVRSIGEDVFRLNYADLELGKSLGFGSFGNVFRAKWRGQEVAVKKVGLNEQEGLGVALDTFLQEVELLASLRCPNVVLFMGACCTPPHVCIVMEYCARGSLYGILSSHRQGGTAAGLTWSRRLQMANDVAVGMNFLHTSQPAIIHRDLKSPNILIAANWQAKVGDLGLSKIMEASRMTATASINSPRWVAPEVLNAQSYGKESDVYSFGVILWEIATLQLPWEDCHPAAIANIVSNKLDQLALPKVSMPEYVQLPQLCALMQDCWKPEAERPSFESIAKRLEEMWREEKRSREKEQRRKELAAVCSPMGHC